MRRTCADTSAFCAASFLSSPSQSRRPRFAPRVALQKTLFFRSRRLPRVTNIQRTRTVSSEEDRDVVSSERCVAPRAIQNNDADEKYKSLAPDTRGDENFTNYRPPHRRIRKVQRARSRSPSADRSRDNGRCPNVTGLAALINPRDGYPREAERAATGGVRTSAIISMIAAGLINRQDRAADFGIAWPARLPLSPQPHLAAEFLVRRVRRGLEIPLNETI